MKSHFNSYRFPAIVFWLLLLLLDDATTRASASTSTTPRSHTRQPTSPPRKSSERTKDSVKTEESYNTNAFVLLAHAIRPIMTQQEQDATEALPSHTTQQVIQAFDSLARAQQTLKTLDGISHEAYQRTHSAQVDESVRGRARRSAARASAAANGLFACELCEFMESMTGAKPIVDEEEADVSGAESFEEWKAALLEGRTILYNSTNDITIDEDHDISLNLLILFEPNYQGGAGLHHGGIQEVSPQHQVNGGRILVLLSDSAANYLDKTLQCLHHDSISVPRPTRSGKEQLAYVHPQLYAAAGKVLERLEPHLNQTSTNESVTAIHFVGRSLAGGVASIAATILDGGMAMPPKSMEKRRSKKSKQVASSEAVSLSSLDGYGRRRTSAVTLGAPPCISSNVPTECITSILYGDDVVCRATKQSMDRFLKRVRKACDRGNAGVLSRQLSRMTDTLAMAGTSLKKQQQSSSSANSLCVPGRAFLIRPRRLENHCSIHEVGQYLKQKREALRAAVLWQLNDILLSKSLWKHHQLESYIHGLDRAQLRGVGEGDEGASANGAGETTSVFEDDDSDKEATMDGVELDGDEGDKEDDEDESTNEMEVDEE